MVKFLSVLLIGLIFESAGVVLLKKGIDALSPAQSTSAPEIARVAKAAILSPQIVLGVFFEALFFVSLLFLMSKSDISFLWPLTALSFVFATLAAILFLHERVSPTRWAGVVLILLGVALIRYSEHEKSNVPSASQPAAHEVNSH